jgi:hypothetical protein
MSVAQSHPFGGLGAANFRLLIIEEKQRSVLILDTTPDRRLGLAILNALSLNGFARNI